jgi:hypothetical protein
MPTDSGCERKVLPVAGGGRERGHKNNLAGAGL